MKSEDRILVQEKHRQLDTLLGTMEADCWLVFCREGSDPSTLLFAGSGMVGTSAFLFTKTGKKVAVVADFDQMEIDDLEVFDEVAAYSIKTQSVEEIVNELVTELAPKRLAMNFSQADPLVDGLTLGMFLRLKEILGDDQLEKRMVSSASILTPLRSQKSPEELRRIKRAIQYTETIMDEIGEYIKVGQTEREVADFIKARQRHYGVTHSFGDGATVATGKVGMGHRGPGNHPLTGGDVVIIDMGIYYEGYTSDMMRTFYILADGETTAPAEVQRRFEVGRDAVRKAVAAMKPGRRGHEIDKIARDHLEANGIEPFTHSLGHQIGRTVHDGGTGLAPLMPRYGERGNAPLVAGEVYTVEPVIPGITGKTGVPIGHEEDVLVTESGAEFLSTPQDELRCV